MERSTATTLEQLLEKAPFHLVKRIREDFTKAQKNVRLVRYEIIPGVNKHGKPDVRVIAYSPEGRSYTMVYSDIPVDREQLDERG